jgi:sugar lactone lactonase YvrE
MKSPISPRTWQPPRMDPHTRSKRRAPASVRTIRLPGTGPEDVLVDAAGRLVTGLVDGRILRLHPSGDAIETVADTRGRPLGIEAFADGTLLVCDARRGLLQVDPANGRVQPLVTELAGKPMRFCNNAAIAADGSIYFSDSSRRFGIDEWRGDLLEHSCTGRLLRRAPDGQVEVLLDGLAFANGVALAADESFVAVAETGAYRVARLWLKGERAGQRDLLIENLHGFPDNIARGSDGLIWITQASPRDPLLDLLLPRAPVLREIAWRLPERLLSPRRTLWVIAVDAAGQIVHDLQGRHPEFFMATGVREAQGSVYLGSLEGSTLAVLTL